MFLTSLSQQARQLLHWLPWSGAGHVLPSPLVTVEVHGHCFTGPWSIMCELILIIKFGGTLSGSKFFRNCASRVGIQWLVPLVRLHTSNIFSKCLRLCISPESCQRNQSWPWISVTIASTQRGSCNACSLRFRAACTFLNLYLPFRA